MNIELKNRPLVSIIIPAYNVGRYIENCILSIIRQSYGNIEILVVMMGLAMKHLILLINGQLWMNELFLFINRMRVLVMQEILVLRYLKENI